MSETAINNDELAAFVASTLNAIAVGVENSSSTTHTFSMPQKVTFEVAVKATKSAEAGGGLKIQVFSAEGKKASADEEVSRITFEIGTATKNGKGTLDLSRVGTSV